MGAGRLHDRAVRRRPMAGRPEAIAVKPRSTLPPPVEPPLGYWRVAAYCHPMLVGQAHESIYSTASRRRRGDAVRRRVP